MEPPSARYCFKASNSACENFSRGPASTSTDASLSLSIVSMSLFADILYVWFNFLRSTLRPLLGVKISRLEQSKQIVFSPRARPAPCASIVPPAPAPAPTTQRAQRAETC